MSYIADDRVQHRYIPTKASEVCYKCSLSTSNMFKIRMYFNQYIVSLEYSRK